MNGNSNRPDSLQCSSSYYYLRSHSRPPRLPVPAKNLLPCHVASGELVPIANQLHELRRHEPRRTNARNPLFPRFFAPFKTFVLCTRFFPLLTFDSFSSFDDVFFSFTKRFVFTSKFLVTEVYLPFFASSELPISSRFPECRLSRLRFFKTFVFLIRPSFFSFFLFHLVGN